MKKTIDIVQNGGGGGIKTFSGCQMLVKYNWKFMKKKVSSQKCTYVQIPLGLIFAI